MNSYAGRVVKRWEEVLEPKGFDALLVSAHLNRISALHQEVIEGLAKPYGLSKMDAVLMFLLRGYEAEPIHLSDISKLYRYTPGAITHRIKRLRKMNFVVTVQSQRDSRAWEVQLTPKGLEVIEEIGIQTSEILAQAVAALSVSEREWNLVLHILGDLEQSIESFTNAASNRPATRTEDKGSGAGEDKPENQSRRRA